MTLSVGSRAALLRGWGSPLHPVAASVVLVVVNFKAILTLRMSRHSVINSITSAYELWCLSLTGAKIKFKHLPINISIYIYTYKHMSSLSDFVVYESK